MAEIVKAGYDPAITPVPVSPAAHYTIGGIVTDLSARTDVAHLYAAGECAATGVHGANRLASNSLLECLVFGRRAALTALDEPGSTFAAVDAANAADAANSADAAGAVAPPAREPVAALIPDERIVTDDVREHVWRDAGVMRDPAALARLALSPDPVAMLVARFALARHESRGVHYRIDATEPDPAFEGHFVLRPGRELTLEHWT